MTLLNLAAMTNVEAPYKGLTVWQVQEILARDTVTTDILKYSDLMISIVDTKGYIRWVNPSWTDYTGWSSEELTERPFMFFVDERDYEATQNAYLKGGATEKNIKEGFIKGFTNRYKCKYGDKVVSLTWFGSNLITHDGYLLAICVPNGYEPIG